MTYTLLDFLSLPLLLPPQFLLSLLVLDIGFLQLLLLHLDKLLLLFRRISTLFEFFQISQLVNRMTVSFVVEDQLGWVPSV